MSLHRRAAKRDANEPEIRAAAESLGACVVPVSGTGVPDLLVGFRGETHLLEVKGRNGKLTLAQEQFRARWTGRPPVVVRCAEDVVKALLGHRVTLGRVLRSEQEGSE